MRMSRAEKTFFEMHLRARVTAQNGIRDPLFCSFVGSVNQQLIFYCSNGFSDETTKSPDSKRHVAARWLRFHPTQIVQGLLTRLSVSLSQYLCLRDRPLVNLWGVEDGGRIKWKKIMHAK